MTFDAKEKEQTSIIRQNEETSLVVHGLFLHALTQFASMTFVESPDTHPFYQDFWLTHQSIQVEFLKVCLVKKYTMW